MCFLSRARAVFAVGVVVLVACARTPDARSPRAEPSLPRCAPTDGADRVVAAGRVIVIGELHGTVEAPAVVGDLACHALARGHAVQVGFELAPEAAAPIERFLRSTGGIEARAALIADALALDDGRGSAAMMDLIERLRGWRAKGADVRVIGFKERGDEQFAAHVEAAHRRMAGSIVLALVGQYHARTRPESPADAPMSWNLRQRGVDVIALDVVHAGGTAWNATSDGVGAHAVEATEPDPKRRRGIRLRASRGFDGTIFVGRVRASPPAVR